MPEVSSLTNATRIGECDDEAGADGIATTCCPDTLIPFLG
jgi:hypothetical protein